LPNTSSAKVRMDCMFSAGVGMQPPWGLVGCRRGQQA
jgi:hypothetical protein